MNLEALIVRTERGLMRKLPPALVLWGNAQLHRRFGEPELHELPKLVTPGSIAVDAGAHFGTYSYALARLVGKHGRVISIEPIEEDATFLATGARQLRLPVEVIQCALSSREGVADIHIPFLHGAQKTALSSLEPGEAGTEEIRQVPVKRLDDVLANVDKSVSFIKIDVEGHEIDVLTGATHTLATQKPNILIEINHDLGNRPISAVFDLILSQGYRGEFLESGRFRRPLSAFDVAKHQEASVGDVLSQEYVNNFIFLPW